ncbi:MAG TPA: hypothetical protein VNE39_01625 [Planctomycetota bacterium]|nr:hypothetical protein [Planctomycetota bacterium]
MAIPLLFFPCRLASLVEFPRPSPGMCAAAGGWGHATVLLGVWRIWAHFDRDSTLFTAAFALIEGWMIAIYALLCMAIYDLSFVQISPAYLFAQSFALVYTFGWLLWFSGNRWKPVNCFSLKLRVTGARPSRFLVWLVLINGVSAVTVALPMAFLTRQFASLLLFPHPSNGMCFMLGGWGLSASVIGVWRIVAFSERRYCLFTSLLALAGCWLLAAYSLLCMAIYRLTFAQVSVAYIYAQLFAVSFALAWALWLKGNRWDFTRPRQERGPQA